MDTKGCLFHSQCPPRSISELGTTQNELFRWAVVVTLVTEILTEPRQPLMRLPVSDNHVQITELTSPPAIKVQERTPDSN